MKRTDTASIIENVTAYCEQHHIRLTKPRLCVLETIASNHGQPIGAYDILEKLRKELDNPKPPTAYRALEFLQKHGFIHRVESLNAYVICHADHRHSGAQFMICDSCGKVTETHLCSIPESLTQRTEAEKFHVTRWNAELHGMCHDCHEY